jgi:hypothetical protein
MRRRDDVIHITRSNVIVMSALADRVLHQTGELPLYAAPLDRSIALHRPTPSRTRVDSWIPYGRVVAREHPLFDRAEQAWQRLREGCRRYQVRVTDTNAPITLRVALPASELAAAVCVLSRRGTIEVDGCVLSLDPLTRRALDDGAVDAAIEQIDGWLTMPWLCGRLAVTAAARPWSSTRADLVLAPVGGRRLRYPRRWFNVGFAIADELRRRVMLPMG